ncbi:WYL domain-containing transcriptional regulator [Paucibacter sp. O1-1]|uniref:helix-turn-helix transcriptional regulator n=1 Tax=Paucibacter sp. M5-1 TaxID=3015998 RepID=UPI0021D4A6BC|nr:WYL domain-containing transcriptional regulator [Paucibacter sp. M5-1]MCU7374748.1 transcriptional regulator [Paucibacter sp. O1-1]MCZ7882033.1 WYL domain-containing transcriptional regulator [Paucibacter sp. M5-1]MDA3829750.1 WYL domain-containing transcriptional regulator [Paucibacter sp. O1-1]
MDRTERFYKIELLIRGRECVSFATLLEALEVSPATLKRDLQYLRERMDAPIEYDALANGYRFGQQWRGQQHELPGVWFNEKELHALLTMHQLLSGLDENGILSRHLQPMFDKLTGMLGTDAAEAKEMTRRVKLISTARRRVASEYFETVGSAVVQRQKLRISYRKRGKGGGTVGSRVVSPQRLVHYRNTWYLDAWCHQSEGLRRFALDAMEAAELLDEKAKPVALKALESELDQGYGIFAGGQTQQARLVFSAEAAAWVSREEWHASQQSEWLADGRWQLEVPYVDATELLMDLLRHAGQVEVLAPPALRQAYAKRLREAAAQLD